MTMPQRILIGKKWDMLSTMIAQGKSDAEIKLALNRPTLDMPYFRKRYADLSVIDSILANAPEAKSGTFNPTTGNMDYEL